MKREERNEISRRRIGESALAEFSQYGYAGASVNNICANGDISKGILYHYFKDKDELYLQCVSDCFDSLVAFLQQWNNEKGMTLEGYAQARLAFFQQNSQQLLLFREAVITPPAHLQAAILDRKKTLDRLNQELLQSVLADQRLRSDITMDQVLSFYQVYINLANAMLGQNASDLGALERYNEAVLLAVNLFLYGVVARDGSPEKKNLQIP